MSFLKKFSAEAKNVYEQKFGGSELEKKVKLSTNVADNWEVSNTVKLEIAQATNTYDGFRQVMPLLWKRLKENSGKWLVILKVLGILDSCIKNGSPRCVDEAREHMYQLRGLQDFHAKDKSGVDRAVGIRERAKNICSLLNDDDGLRKLRASQRDNSGSYEGMGNRGSSGSRMSSRSGGRTQSRQNGSSRSAMSPDQGRSGRSSGGGRGFSDARSSPVQRRPEEEVQEEPEVRVKKEKKKKKKKKRRGDAEEAEAGGDDDDFGEFSAAPVTVQAPTNPNPPASSGGFSSAFTLAPPSNDTNGINFPSPQPTATTQSSDAFDAFVSAPAAPNGNPAPLGNGGGDDWGNFESVSSITTTTSTATSSTNGSAAMLDIWGDASASTSTSAPAPAFSTGGDAGFLSSIMDTSDPQQQQQQGGNVFAFNAIPTPQNTKASANNTAQASSSASGRYNMEGKLKLTNSGVSTQPKPKAAVNKDDPTFGLVNLDLGSKPANKSAQQNNNFNMNMFSGNTKAFNDIGLGGGNNQQRQRQQQQQRGMQMNMNQMGMQMNNNQMGMGMQMHGMNNNQTGGIQMGNNQMGMGIQMNNNQFQQQQRPQQQNQQQMNNIFFN
jgi:hypothetical protein